ncbi:MAG: aldolase catalytic domain-containing protein, partial [Thermodesulfovibrionales bacterium]|nr:aldolase catalytic domain-containing protein [Thermodesulfovibrionales bacterium]
MYRPEIKVLDCTVRDGGLINNWQFTDDFVKKVFHALSNAGVDYMEIGYKSSEKYFSRAENGAWKFCSEEDIKRVLGEMDTKMKLSAMADIGRIDYHDIPKAGESVFDMIRVACYAKEADKGIALAHHCMDKGYETTINLMAVSKVLEKDLDEALGDLAKSSVPTIYLVDSFGSLYSEQIQFLAKKYKEALPGKELGIHAHNNQQLAFANTIEAIICGVNRLDATLYGMGRGAGNCPLELLLSFLKNPKFDIRPVLEVIQESLIPLKEEVEWGYHLPYMITGILNEHPRAGMKAMARKELPNLRQLYEDLRDGTPLE